MKAYVSDSYEDTELTLNQMDLESSKKAYARARDKKVFFMKLPEMAGYSSNHIAFDVEKAKEIVKFLQTTIDELEDYVKPKKMTKEEIEKELGYDIEIIPTKKQLSDLEVDDVIYVRDCVDDDWAVRHFSHVDEDGDVRAFVNGQTSKETSYTTFWELYSIEKPEELL